MDAYNRGYDAKIGGLSDASDGTAKIGNATVSFHLQDAQIAAQSVTASFYALAYTLDASVGGVPVGTTIISYRGTDQVTPSLERDTWGDLLTGWTLGAGFRQASNYTPSSLNV